MAEVRITALGLRTTAEKTEVGIVQSVSATGFIVQLKLGDDEDGAMEDVTFNIPEDVTLLDAELVNKLKDFPVVHRSTRMLAEAPQWLIYKDGSCGQGVGDAGAAVVIKHMKSKKCWAIGRYGANSTNNGAEYVALGAALRIAPLLPGQVAILGDSDLVYGDVVGTSSCSKPHLAEISHETKQLWISMDLYRVSYHRMDGHKGELPMLADLPAKMAKNNRKDFMFDAGVDDGRNLFFTLGRTVEHSVTRLMVDQIDIALPAVDQLFSNLPVSTPKPSARRLPAVSVPEVAAADAAAGDIGRFEITKVTDYLSIRALGSRSDVPRQVRPLWARIQRAAIDKILQAESVELRNDAMFEFMTLPNRWLPRCVATRRIIDRFREGRPFKIEQPKQRSQVEKFRERRLAELVTRKAKDFNIRGAVDVLRNEAETPSSLTDEERFEALRKKFHDTLKFPIEGVLKDQNLSTVPAAAVKLAIKHMKRTAAPCIDGWCKAMVVDAIEDEPELLASWCTLLTQLIRGQFGPIVMQCLRTARLVPIPKPDGGVRPIAVSNFFLKLIGAVALKLDGATCREWQYAIGKPGGTKEMAHKLRAHAMAGDTVCKFDLGNGFGEAAKAVAEGILAKRPFPWLQAYFRNFCYAPRILAVFDKSGARQINAVDGFCQGDATSCFFFCLVVDLAIEKILEICNKEQIQVKGVYAFVDDINWAVATATDACRLGTVVKEVFASLKMPINLGKSSSMIPHNDPYWTMPEIQEQFRLLNIGTQGQDKSFVIVGADIAPRTDNAFLREQIAKQEAFFKLLDRVDIHPAILFTILRICGNPRLEYVCSVMPPTTKMAELCARFDDLIVASMNSATLLAGRLKPGHFELLFDAKGAGFTRYSAVHAELYEMSKRQCLSATKSKPPRTGLVTTDPNLPVHVRGATDLSGNWMMWKSSFTQELQPSQYVAALCLKLNVLPESVPFPVKCNCGKTVTCDAEFIGHTYTCDRFTPFTHLHRHNEVMYGALVPLAKSYGIHCTTEPSFYTYEEKDGHTPHNRPDITFHTSPPIATDITIVAPVHEVDIAANEAAHAKVKKHRLAVQQMGHTFEPFALEIQGHMHECCYRVIRTLQRDLMPMHRLQFFRDATNAVSIALAKGRAEAIRAAIARTRAMYRAY